MGYFRQYNSYGVLTPLVTYIVLIPAGSAFQRASASIAGVRPRRGAVEGSIGILVVYG